MSFEFVFMMFESVFSFLPFGSICMIRSVSSDSTLTFMCRVRGKFDVRNCFIDFISEDVF